MKKTKFSLVAICLAVILSLTFAATCFTPSTASALEISSSFNLEEQWYAAENHFDYAATLDVVERQNFPTDKEYYKENPIVVAVIDSGLYFDHPVFDGLLYENEAEIAGNGIDDDNSGKIDDICGWNFVFNNALPLDDSSIPGALNSHGTHAAGIVAQMIRGYGLQDYVRIMPIKAGNSDIADKSIDFSSANVISAIKYAVKMGADVINMSFGSYGNSVWGEESSLHDAIRDAYEQGVIMVAAAGNDGKCAILPTSTFYPAAYDEVIGVMAYVGSEIASQDGQMGAFNSGKFSNYGDCYDVVAPGKNIYSAYSPSCASGTYYGEKDGTSMAAPFVSAMAAILLLKTGGDYQDVRDIMKYADAPEVSRQDSFGTEYTFKKASLKDMLQYYVPVLRVEIEQIGGEAAQILGLTDVVNYKALLFNTENIVYPDGNENYERVHWTVTREASGRNKEVSTGDGQYFSFTPDVVGEYKVSYTATQNDKVSSVLSLAVVYATQADIPILVVGGADEYVNGNTYTFEVNALEYYDPNYAPRLNWYVNDKLVPLDSGASFTFEPETRGEYRIVCKIAGGEEVFNQTVVVERSAEEKQDLYLTIGLSVGAAVVVAIVLAFAIVTIKKRRAPKDVSEA